MAHAFCDVIDTHTMVGMVERAGVDAKGAETASAETKPEAVLA